MNSKRSFRPRLRVVLLTALLTATSFITNAAPASYDGPPGRSSAPIPFGLGPQSARAAYCATPNPTFTGRLTASSASTTAVTDINNPTVYGYISNVEGDWACTLYRRYDGLGWNTSSSLGTFVWGTLLNSTSVNCNWAIGTDDYLKANDTADCPDFDAEYAMSIDLSPTGTYQNDNTHDSTGDFGFTHSDCDTTPYYGAKVTKTGQSFTGSNVSNRPGANCDVLTLDGTATTQTVNYDTTAPSVTWTAPTGGPTMVATYGVDLAWTESDNLTGIASRSLQRQKATLSGTSCLTDWANDGAAVSIGASPQAVGDLALSACYRWKLTVTDGAGNSSTQVTSGSIYRDTTSGLGADSQFTFESLDLGAGDGLAVNVASGNLFASHPIVSLPIRGGSVSLGLSYNSQDSASIGVGPGWRLSVQRRLALNGDGTVTYTDPSGARHKFTSPSTVGTVTTYTRPATLYATLVKDTSQTPQFTLTFRDRSVDKFTTSGSEGLLSSSVDRFANGYTIAYESGSSRVSTLTENGNNRVINFAWDGSARLSSITDWAWIDGSGIVQTTATGSRRTYRFFYDASSRLAGWSDPLNLSGSCPTGGSHLTCLTYTGGLLSAVAKTQTYTTLSGGALGSSTRTITTQVTYGGANVATVRDAEQTYLGGSSTTFTAYPGPGLQVVRPATPSGTTTYILVSSSETLGRVRSILRRLGSTDLEQRTTWDTSQLIEPASVTDNYGAQLSTPARTVSYTYLSNSMGLVSRLTEPLDASNNRTTDYAYNANNDVTQVIVALNGSGTTRTITRYCYVSSGCSTSATGLTMLSVIDNYVDGTKGGSTGNREDITTDYQDDSYGQRTRETRSNYDASGNLLDSRAIGYTYDANGNQTAQIANYVDSVVSSGGDDVTPNATTLARTDLTTALTFDTAGNQVSAADPRRPIEALGVSLGADDYVTRWQFDGLNERVRETTPTTPGSSVACGDSTAPFCPTWIYDELGNARRARDFGNLVIATEFDRSRRPTTSFEDSPTASAVETARDTYDAAGRLLTAKNQLQIADSTLGYTLYDYDELGRTEDISEAHFATGTDIELITTTTYDALDRKAAETVGDLQTTRYTYDLGVRVIDLDDEFTCTSTTYDYRDLATTEIAGQTTGSCSGAGDHTTTNTYDGLGRLTAAEVTAGTGLGNKPSDLTLDSAGHALYSASYVAATSTTTSVTSVVNPLDQVVKQTRSDSSISKTTFDPVGNELDSCYWAASPDDTCKPVGSSFTNAPTRLTTTGYDARNQRISLQDAGTNATTVYDPDHNYQVKSIYIPTGTGKEHQSLYSYDERHRVTTITHQLCTISSGHNCSSTTSTGSDSYAYDDNDNRTQVNESNGSTSGNRFYCYDAQNRLIYRNTGAACSATAKDETYVYGSGGNRKQTVVSGVTKNFTYSSGQLCKDGGTSCTTPNVFYDANGRTSNWNGWWFSYDAEGRLIKACKSSTCASTADKVEFTYDGDGHRTQIKTTPASGSTTTTNFRYQDGAVVEERDGSNTLLRSYLVDESGAIVKMIIPTGQTGVGTYLVTWNGHGDALALYRIETSGSLTLANSYTYSSWGAPTTATHNSIADLAFRFLYVGAHDVQWDNYFGVGLYDMRARHYAPAIGRFIQPDPVRSEPNLYWYAGNDPVTSVDPRGTETMNPLETAKCNKDWLACQIFKRDSAWAAWIAYNYYPNETNLGRGDALRHCIWQCLLTLDLGAAEAADWGNLHEYRYLLGVWIPDWRLPSIMDRYNNIVGRAIGRDIMQDWLVASFPVIAAKDRCLRALRNGRLVIIRNGQLVWSTA